MIIILEEEVYGIELTEQSVVVIETYDFDLPSGITASVFTAKGELIVGLGAGTYAALPVGPDGTYPTADSNEASGIKWEIPTITVNDTTNHLINGGFNFAQGQTPGTLTTIADGGYGPDQWKSYRENADLQYRRVDASGEAGLTSPYYGEFKKITNAGKILFFQPLEYMNTLKFRGKVVGFQLQMKANSARTMRVAVVELQAAGTKDTLPAAVSAWGADGTDPTLGANLAVIGTPVSCSVTTAMQTFQFTGTFPSNSKNLLVMVWSNADFAVNDTLGVAEAGLYFGESQRSWTPRPEREDLRLCQSYFFSSYNIDVIPGTTGYNVAFFAGTTASLYGAFSFPSAMRVNPTVTIYSYIGTVGKVTNSGGGEVGTVVTGTAYQKALFLLTDSGSGFTAGNVYLFNFTANARL